MAQEANDASTRALSRYHQEQILEALLREGPASRPQLGTLTGMSPATVTRLVAGLLELGLVSNAGRVADTGGRPSMLVGLNARAVVAGAIDIGTTLTCSGFVDLAGNAFDVRREAVDVSAGPGARVEHTLATVDALLERAREQDVRCVSIGVSIPGVTTEIGHVTTAPCLDWRDVPLGAMISGRSGTPVVVENDANALVLAEHWWGPHRDAECLVAVALSWGIAAGVVTGGQLFRGSHRMAGEIGHMLTDRSAMSQYFPRYGDLETRIGIDGITARAQEKGITGEDGYMTAERVFDQAASGEPVARELLDSVLDDLAIALGNVAVMMDPDVIVLGGGVGEHAELIIPGIVERLSGRIPHVPRFAGASLGLDQWLIGAGSLALKEAGSPLDLV